MYLPQRHALYPGSQHPSQHNSTLHSHIPNSRSFFGPGQQSSLLHPSSGSSFTTSAERHAHPETAPVSAYLKAHNPEIVLAPRDPDYVHNIIPHRHSPPEALINIKKTHTFDHYAVDNFRPGDVQGENPASIEATGQKRSGPARTRKQRRERPRIELAPGQPPTTQGRPRERVFVACLQWSASFLVTRRLSIHFKLNQPKPKNTLRRRKTSLP
jgi:hypothetical protein